MAPAQVISNPALAGRIQGFGNVNPPPLEEENAKTVAKRAVSNLGSMLGEEVLLTVDDFRQKGAVGAVKDAVADAGDLLIDGVTGVFGWLRGDPPAEEEDSENAEKAQNALTQGPAGAAYGVSQASPTGGINAVWVMPEEADPAMLAELASQARSNAQPSAFNQVPGGPTIQPYQPNAPMQIPGGPIIQPYTPSAPGQRPPPFKPSMAPNFQNFPGAAPPSVPSGSTAGSTATGTRSLVEQVAKGETIAGPQVAKRLLSQSASAKLSAQQLGDVMCERVRRLYLGLDSSADADAAIMRVLGLVDAIAQQDGELAKATVKVVTSGISEELISLQSSRQHRSAAEPLLRRVGLLKQTPEAIDLLGGDEAAPAAQVADLLGDAAAPAAAPARAAGSLDLL